MGIKSREDFASEDQYRAYLCSDEVVRDRAAKCPEFAGIVDELRKSRAYVGGYIKGEYVEPQKESIEIDLRYYAQVNDLTKVITVVYCKCPKSKEKGDHNLELYKGDESRHCDTVEVFDQVLNHATYQNNVITPNPNSSTRCVNGRAKCIPKDDDCGCKDITKVEAELKAEVENILAKFVYEKYGTNTLCINGGGHSVEKKLVPLLRGKGTFTHKHGWHLSTWVSGYR